MSSVREKIALGKVTTDEHGVSHVRLTQDKIPSFARLHGATVKEVGKMCDFCAAELPLSHESQHCRRQNCPTIYDTCEACAVKRRANKKYNYCFKDHMRERDMCIRVYGASYADRWGLDNERFSDCENSSSEETSPENPEKHPDIELKKEMFAGRTARVQTILDAMEYYDMKFVLKKPDGPGLILEQTWFSDQQ